MWDKIIVAEPLWVLLVVPSLLLPEYFWEPWAYPWAIGLLFLFWPIRLFRERRLAPESPLNLPAILLLIWAILAIQFSAPTEDTYLVLAMLAAGVTLYFAIVNAEIFKQYPILVVFGLLAAGLLLAGLGPAILSAIPQKLFVFDASVSRSKPIDIFGTNETVNSNILAGSLLMVIPLAAALTIHRKWVRSRWFWQFGKTLLFGSIAILMISTLLLTQSRGSYMALALALILLFTLQWRWTLLILAVMLLSGIWTLSWDGLKGFVEAVGSDGSITSLSGRSEIWVGSFFALLNFPLFGIGLGKFQQIMPALLPQLEIFQTAKISHAHNLFLQVGLDLGFPGLLLYLWLWITAIVAQVRARNFWIECLKVEGDNHDRHKNRQRKQRRSIVLRIALTEGLLATTLALMLHGLVDVVIWGAKPAPLSWLLLALTSLLYFPYAEQVRADATLPISRNYTKN